MKGCIIGIWSAATEAVRQAINTFFINLINFLKVFIEILINVYEFLSK